MIITLIGTKTYSLGGKRYIKGIPVEVSSYVANLARKTGLFKIGEKMSTGVPTTLDLTGRPTIVYPKTVEYDIMKQRPHHLLAAFARQGYFVVFIDLKEGNSYREVAPNMFVVSGDISIKFGKPTTLYWTFPKHVSLYPSHDYLIFDTIDLPEGAFHHWQEGYTLSLQKADLVLASSKLLYDRAKEYNENVVLVPNAVDYDMFKVAQNRLYPIPEGLDGRPVVGFYGALGVWIDTDLIVKTCKAMPEYQFLIIGPTYGNPIVEVPENMVKYELLPYEDLPRYLSWFDVGIIPFKSGGVSVACNPLKMWEYMSAGKPFVVTNLPEATHGISATERDFAYKIQWAMQCGIKDTLIGAASKNNWDERVKSIRLPFKLPVPIEKDRTKTITVFLACSPSWWMHVEKQIYAMDKLCSTCLNVIVLTDGSYNFTTYEHTNVRSIDFENVFNATMPFGTNVEERYSKYTLYRLLIPRYFADYIHTDQTGYNAIDKAIYLDADTLVNCDLWDLFNRDVDMIAGVQDTGATKHMKELGLERYVNAGVLLMNLVNLSKVSDKWLAMVNTKEYRFNDQDIINLTCNIEYLPPCYNQSVCTPEASTASIVHFAGVKPWAPGYKSALWDSVGFQYKIPKVIHYCWFGGGEKPPIVKQCIDSWKRHAYEYKLVEWNESSINIKSHKYLQAAYESGKYAFVSDYVRMYALANFGGIYMDSDYELFKPIDEFRKHRAFTGHETPEIPITAIMGAEANHPWIKRLLAYFDTAVFEIKPNTAVIPTMMKEYYKETIDEVAIYQEDLHVYNVETFCPYDHKNLKATPTGKSYGVHHFSGSWLGRPAINVSK